MGVSASEVVTAYLVSQNVAGRPAANPTWPMTKGQIPVDGDRWITAFDLTGKYDGKYQADGKSVIFPRVQVITRSKNYDEGELQSELILATLSPVRRVVVTCLGGIQVLFEACMIIQSTAYLYQEEKNRRQCFVAVVQPTISEV